MGEHEQPKAGWLLAALCPWLEGKQTPEQERELALDMAEIRQALLRQAFGCDMTKKAEA